MQALLLLSAVHKNNAKGLQYAVEYATFPVLIFKAWFLHNEHDSNTKRHLSGKKYLDTIGYGIRVRPDRSLASFRTQDACSICVWDTLPLTASAMAFTGSSELRSSSGRGSSTKPLSASH